MEKVVANKAPTADMMMAMTQMMIIIIILFIIHQFFSKYYNAYCIIMRISMENIY